MDNDILTKIGRIEMKEEDINLLSPLVLAYIGDIVYEMFVRTMLVTKYKNSVHKLHLKAIKYVSANAQAEITRKIMEKLSDKEYAILKRGRNAKSGTIPKNASVIDYKYATGFESLIGYLYLSKDFDRLKEIISFSFEMVES